MRHIAADNVTAAFAMEDRIRLAVERLQDLPESGRPGFRPGTRELVVAYTAYIVTYRVEQDRVDILHVTHGRRQLTP